MPVLVSIFHIFVNRAVVFGVPIGGHLFVEGLLLVVIIFLLSQKSYKPPKCPLTTKEIDELCDEWMPESLIPPIYKRRVEKGSSSTVKVSLSLDTHIAIYIHIMCTHIHLYLHTYITIHNPYCTHIYIHEWL
ncbi:putative serine C-palmitoyltransferase [Helianthus debilis subsp. tardiflorus]